MRFRSILKNRDLFVVSALSLWERVARQAPGEGSPSHDFQKSTDGGAGCPHPALAAPPSPDGRRTRPSFSNLFRTALVCARPYFWSHRNGSVRSASAAPGCDPKNLTS